MKILDNVGPDWERVLKTRIIVNHRDFLQSRDARAFNMSDGFLCDYFHQV